MVIISGVPIFRIFTVNGSFVASVQSAPSNGCYREVAVVER